jgi:hypothetical protein
MPEDKQVRMQRVRVGLTGLAAVMLIVAVSTAIFESAKVGEKQGPVAPGEARSEQAVANMLNNDAVEQSEPLAEIGVTPGAAPDESTQPAAPAR